MSNQPPAHVADERAAFEAWAELTDDQKRGAQHDIVGWYYFDDLTQDRWDAWQARAAIPAGADASGCERIFPPEFDKFNPDGLEGTMSPSDLWDYACLVGWRSGHFAAGAQAETPKPVGENLPAEAWVTPLRYGSRVTFYKPPKPDGWDDDEDKWYCYPLVRAAQPTPAPATDAKLLLNVTNVQRPSDQSVRLVFTSCHQASLFERAARAAMLSANSPREAG